MRHKPKPNAYDASGNPVWICIFCHSQEDPSREHVLAAKWRKHLGVPASGQSNTGWVLKSLDGSPVWTEEVKPKQDPFTWTVKSVCKSCNTGWMRELEELAEPALLPLALAQDATLSAAQVRVIENWLAKTGAGHRVHGRGREGVHSRARVGREAQPP